MFVHIRAPHLTSEACKTVAAAIVGSRLDYCNSLLAGTSVSNLARFAACPEHTCSGRCPETSLLPHYTPVLADLHWLPIRPSQNKFQDCYHCFQGIAFPAAILSRCPCPTVCAHAITAIFLFLVNMHSLTKNRNGKVQVVLVRCLGHVGYHLIFHPFPLVLLSGSKRLKHHLFSSAFPGISTPSTNITLCDVITSTNVNHARCTLPPS